MSARSILRKAARQCLLLAALAGCSEPPSGGLAPSHASETPPARSVAPLEASSTPGARSVEPVASASAAPPGSDLGELKVRESAMRSIDDALFVEAGHAERARADARLWAADLRADPKLLADGGAAAFGVRLALDATTAPIILAAVATIDAPDEVGELATDFLDDLARRGDPAGRLTLLARDLRDLKKARSKALAVVLSLDGVTSPNCEGAKHLLLRLRSDGDSRALDGIARLGKSGGCGPKGADDCFPCLRDREAAKLLSSTTEACRARPFKPPWRLSGARP